MLICWIKASFVLYFLRKSKTFLEPQDVKMFPQSLNMFVSCTMRCFLQFTHVNAVLDENRTWFLTVLNNNVAADISLAKHFQTKHLIPYV